MLKVGLIGCGFMGTMHANCYKALEDKVKIVAVADVRRENAEELAKLFSSDIYSDGMDLITNADVDFVDVCLPTYLHAKYAIAAMEKGFDVFVEKPLCRTKEEAKELLDVQAKTGRKAQVGQVIRFWDEYAWLKDFKEKGEYGKLINAAFKRLSPRPDWAWDNWLHTPEKSGGMALDLHIHDTDFMRYLMGEPKEVKAVGLEEKAGLNEYIMTIYEYDDAVLTAEAAWNYPASFPFTAGFRAKFEKATVVFEGGVVTVYPVSGEAFNPVIESACTLKAGSGNISDLGGYYNELKYFLEFLENPTGENIAPLKEGARSVELALEQIEKANK